MAELIPLPLSFPIPSHLAYKKAVADLDKLIYQIIDQHKRGENVSVARALWSVWRRLIGQPGVDQSPA